MVESPVAHSLTINTPPRTIDDVHDLLATIWRERPMVPTLDQFAFETAVIELTANIIRHADSGGGVTCELRIAVQSDHLEAVVLDTGRPGEITQVDRSMPDDDFAESGRGLALINALVDEVSYDRVAGKNRWRILRRLNP